MPLGRRLRVAVLAVGWLYGVWVPAAFGDASRPDIRISVQGDRLMARIERASLRRVLAELDRRTCARSELFDPADDDTVRERFDALPMEEALRRLLGGRSFMIVHDTADTALGATEHAPMQRVVILPRSAAARAEPPGPAHAGPTLDDLAQAMVDPDERTRARAQALFEQALARGAEPSAADPPRPR